MWCVPVEDARLVHVVHGLDELVHVAPDALLRHIVAAPPDQLIDVHVHKLKDQRQPACGLVTAGTCLAAAGITSIA